MGVLAQTSATVAHDSSEPSELAPSAELRVELEWHFSQYMKSATTTQM
jgi:hypothetical protein